MHFYRFLSLLPVTLVVALPAPGSGDVLIRGSVTAIQRRGLQDSLGQAKSKISNGLKQLLGMQSSRPTSVVAGDVPQPLMQVSDDVRWTVAMDRDIIHLPSDELEAVLNCVQLKQAQPGAPVVGLRTTSTEEYQRGLRERDRIIKGWLQECKEELSIARHGAGQQHSRARPGAYDGGTLRANAPKTNPPGLGHHLRAEFRGLGEAAASARTHLFGSWKGAVGDPPLGRRILSGRPGRG